MSHTIVPQRQAALERAQAVKAGMSDLRESIRSGVLTLDEAIRDPRSGPMTVDHLLRRIQRIGPRSALRIQIRAGAPGHLRVRDLTDRQCHALVTELRREVAR